MKELRVLVACEHSGRVREAFRERGHYALSCDLLPTDIPGEHWQGPVQEVLYQGRWDLAICFPPCTYLTKAGAHLWPQRSEQQAGAVEFVRMLADAPIERIAIENPAGALTRLWRKPDQTIQPWEHGDPYVKTTQLWLKGLPRLVPTQIVQERREFVMDVANKLKGLPGPVRAGP
jgi:hypothetical protein